MTPLIDVMLVLLVMLIIIVPLQTHSVPMVLAEGGQPTDPLPSVALTLSANGAVAWDGRVLADGAELEARLREAAHAVPTPGLMVRAEPAVPYRAVVHVLARAQQLGITGIGLGDGP